jgi:hypothetical protein
MAAKARRVVLALFVVLALARTADAALIVVGDGNISNALLTPAAFDNDTWFLNVLAGGNTVLVDDSSIGVSGTINDFFNSVAGVTSSLLGGELTAADLVGVELFISPASNNIYSAAEIAVMGAFLAGGGHILLMAEHSGFPVQIANVNTVLAALGSTMVVPDQELCGLNTLTGAQIANHPLNAGVASFQMGCTSQVVGGTPLFFPVPGFAMAAVEGDVNLIPEPATLSLLGIGLAGLARRRLRKA